jgi:hypothetical protein
MNTVTPTTTTEPTMLKCYVAVLNQKSRTVTAHADGYRHLAGGFDYEEVGTGMYNDPEADNGIANSVWKGRVAPCAKR